MSVNTFRRILPGSYRRVYLSVTLFLGLGTACGKSEENHDQIFYGPVATNERVYPVSPASTVQDRCFNLGRNVCSGDQLNFISSSPTVTVDSILQRTFVHQSWAGERLKQIFTAWPADLLQMAGCARAIYVGNSLPFSLAQSDTYSIYLNARDIALTTDELATLTNKDDPRDAAFDTAPYREVFFYDSDATLSADDKRIARIHSVLIHELAHACDFRSDTAPSSNLPKLDANAISDYAQLFLYGDETKRAAVTAEPLADFLNILNTDGAVNYYSYSDRYEHFAMLVETALLKKYFNVYEDAIYAAPFKSTATDAEITLNTGIFRKICTPAAWTNARAAVDGLSVFSVNPLDAESGCTNSMTPVNQTLDAFKTAHPNQYF